MSLEILFVGIYAVCAGLSIWSAGKLTAFLKATPRISGDGDLERFKSLVRTQMALALAVIGLMAVGIICGLVIIVRHGLVGLLGVLAANGIGLALGLNNKRIEKRVQSLEAESDTLAVEFRRICHTWVKKPWPDF